MNFNIRICLLYMLFVGVFSIKTSKDYGNLFTCGKLFYRTLFHRTGEGRQIFVGAMDWVFRLNMKNINHTSCENGTDGLNLVPSNVNECIKKSLSKDYHCRNHITLIKNWYRGDDTLFFCGTNAYDPRVFSIEKHSQNISTKDMKIIYHSIRADTGRCPFSPDANYAAVERDGEIFVGSGRDVNNSITTVSLHTVNVTVEEAKKSYIRTDYNDSKYLHSPDFIFAFLSFNMERMFFVFRELAYQNETSPDGFYISRIATVCMKDQGVQRDGYKTWGSYVKASLICDADGRIKYNKIVDVARENIYNEVFIALFTTQDSGGSVLCHYYIRENKERVFKGPFEQDFSGRNSNPVASNLVPNPHPFDCPKTKTESVPSPTLDFSINHPLMHESLRVWARYETKTINYTKIARVGSRMRVYRDYSIFAGTSDGQIHHLNLLFVHRTWFYILYDVIEITPAEPIRAMIYDIVRETLYVSSDSAVHEFVIKDCEKRFKTCLECTLDKMCTWDHNNKKCIQEHEDDEPKKFLFLSNMCEDFPVHVDSSTLAFKFRNRIKCKSIFATKELLNYAKEDIKWYRCNGNQPLTNCEDASYSCTKLSLIIKEVSYGDEHCFKCKLMGATLYRVKTSLSDIKMETFVSISGQTLEVKCQNSKIQENKILSSDIYWFPCFDEKDDGKIYETPTKPSNANFSAVFSPVTWNDVGCYTCETETDVLYAFNLRVIIPVPHIVSFGSTARLACKRRTYGTDDIPANVIEWVKTMDQRNFSKIEQHPKKYSFEKNILVIENVGNADKGYYNCKIEGKNSYSYDLKVVGIVPELYVLNYDLNAKLMCKISSHISGDFVWLISSNLENFTKLDQKKKYKFHNRTLIINRVDDHDEGYYNCRVGDTNVYGYDLKVVKEYFLSPLSVVNTGQTAHFECLNELFNKIEVPPRDIKWYKCNDQETPIPTGTKKYSIKSKNLSIHSTNDQDMACYICKLNETRLRKIELLILNITSQKYDVDMGRKAIIECKHPMMRRADIPAKRIVWYRCNNEENITKLKSDGIKYSTKDFSLIILSVEKKDLGCYRCESRGVILHIANVSLSRGILPMKGGACEKKYTSWKYIFVMHVFVMVMKIIF